MWWVVFLSIIIYILKITIGLCMEKHYIFWPDLMPHITSHRMCNYSHTTKFFIFIFFYLLCACWSWLSHTHTHSNPQIKVTIAVVYTTFFHNGEIFSLYNTFFLGEKKLIWYFNVYHTALVKSNLYYRFISFSFIDFFFFQYVVFSDKKKKKIVF